MRDPKVEVGNQKRSRIDCMTKIIILFALYSLLAAQPSSAQAQQFNKIAQIGLLSAGSSSAGSPRIEAFRQGLRELGYQEGNTVTIEYRFAEGKLERLPA